VVAVDLSHIIDVIFAALGTIFLAIGKSFHIRLREVETSQSRMHEIYVRRDDFKEHMDRVYDILERIETKLDGKADKP
jgi:hypothetical protein